MKAKEGTTKPRKIPRALLSSPAISTAHPNPSKPWPATSTRESFHKNLPKIHYPFEFLLFMIIKRNKDLVVKRMGEIALLFIHVMSKLFQFTILNLSG